MEDSISPVHPTPSLAPSLNGAFFVSGPYPE